MDEMERLNRTRRRFIEILLEPADGQTPVEIAQRIGVSPATYHRYCNDRKLLQIAYRESSLRAFSRLPRLLLVQAGKAEEGDLNAAKFLLQHARDMGLATMETEDRLTTEDIIHLIHDAMRDQQQGGAEP